ncbi:MAG TPA: tetratricopeptide repeat protein [Verrucomicrobiae bacterium]
MRRLRWRNYLFVFGLAFLTACRPPGPRALLDGDRLIREGKYPQAITKLQKATQLLPANAQAWNHLGLAYQYAGQPNEAVRAYQQAITVDRNLAAVRFNLGTLYLEQNRVNDAINELTTATVLEPGSLAAWVNLGKAQLRARRVDEAERSFVTVLRADPKNVEALNYYGVTLLHRRKASDARAYFNEALKYQPDYSPAVFNQAVVFHYYIVNKPQALARYQDYLRMKPDASGAAAANEAIRALEAELQPKPVVVVATNTPTATNRLVAMTNHPSAHTNVAAIKTNAAPATLHTTNIAETAHAATNKPIATNRTVATITNKPSEIVSTPPKPAPKTNIVVAAAPVTNEPPKTVEKPIEQPEPQKPLEVVNLDEEPKLAVAKDIAPPPKPATTTPSPTPPKTVAAATVTNAPSEEPPLIRPARREEKEKGTSLTSTILRKANPVNWFRRSKEEEKSDKTEKIVAKAPEPPVAESTVKELPEPPKEAVPEVKPEPVFARYPYQTTPLPRDGNHAAAEPLFNEAVIAHQEGKLGKAMDGYRAALRQDPRYFDAQLNLGIAAAQASDLSLALASLEDAVRVSPKSTEARYQFAMALRRANYPIDAVNELKTLLEDTPNEARAYLALGNLYSQVLNKPELAVTNYQRVLEIAPQHPQAPQIRAWLMQH